MSDSRFESHLKKFKCSVSLAPPVLPTGQVQAMLKRLHFWIKFSK